MCQQNDSSLMSPTAQVAFAKLFPYDEMLPADQLKPWVPPINDWSSGQVAVGEMSSIILLHPPPPLVGVLIAMEI